MGIYDRQIASALKIIRKKGASAILRKLNSTSPSNPDEPWKPSADAIDDTNISIVILPPLSGSGLEISFNKSIDNSLIPKNLQIGLIGNNLIEPDLKDLVIINSIEYTIYKLATLAPNGESLLFVVGIAK